MKTLGFNKYIGCGNGLEKEMNCGWLPYDTDMMNVTTPKYLGKEGNFMTYYITVSGHSPYNLGSRPARRYIKEKYNKPGNVYLGLVHRLDRPTGGVMVFARTSKAAARLSEQVRDKKMHKKYLCIVDGKMEKDEGTFRDYLVKNEKTNTSKVVKEGTKNAKEAILDYKVLKYNEEINMSVVKVDLHTGRHHQIRVQFASRNHSLSGDQKYGTRGQGKQIALWAYELTINHTILSGFYNQ